MDKDLIASINLGDRVYVRFYSDGSLHMHDEAPVIGRGVGLSSAQWKRLNKILSSFDESAIKEIFGSYNRDFGKELERMHQLTGGDRT